MSPLRSSPYVTIEYLEELRVVRFERTALPFGDVHATRAELGRWLSALDGIDTTRFGVLLDFRRTPMTSDPDILTAVVTEVDRIALLFPRRAILLTAALLGPQSDRVTRAGAKITPFIAEAEAWSHVRS
ncbi:MAG TPA: hypothetical protein VFX59_30085 [Polyangiales bacterium]|nr:hypothetical protein [Polyangiales bacterium]